MTPAHHSRWATFQPARHHRWYDMSAVLPTWRRGWLLRMVGVVAAVAGVAWAVVVA